MDLNDSSEIKGKSSQPKNTVIDPHLIRYMQIALAFAIIRIKPANKSAREYTEEICVQFRQNQLKLKDKADSLRNEVLLLKQQLLQQKWKSDGLLPQKEGQDSEGTEAGSPDSNPLPCTPEATSDTPQITHTQQELLSQHASFLRNLLLLSEISMQEATESQQNAGIPCAIDPTCEQTALESAQSALITLGELLTNCSTGSSTIISPKMLNHMVQVITGLVDSQHCSNYFCDSLCNIVLCFVWCITGTICNNQSFGETASEHLSTVTQKLARSVTLRPPIVQMLVTHIGQFAVQLQTTCDGSLLNQQLLTNCYFIMRTLERILQQEIASGDKCLGVAFCQGVYQKLDNCLVGISNTCSPFLQYVWHIEGILQCMHPHV